MCSSYLFSVLLTKFLSRNSLQREPEGIELQEFPEREGGNSRGSDGSHVSNIYTEINDTERAGNSIFSLI
jgi:hypothetical protein